MRIRTRLQIMTALSAALVAVMALLLYWSHHRLGMALQADNLSDHIVTSMFERASLRSDYLRNDNQRAKDQWFTKHSQIVALLKQAPLLFETDENSLTIGDMLRSIESSEAIFQQIVHNRNLGAQGVRPVPQASEIENRLVAQLLLKEYETIADAARLQDGSDALIDSNQRTMSNLSLAFVGSMAALVVLTACSLSRIINKGISDLHEGAATFGTGNLDHRIGVRGTDEFTEVAGTFNAMAEKLKGSYAALEREIAERKRAAAEVESLNRDLEHTVSKLEAANKELEAFSYSVSHDLRAPLRAIDSFSRIVVEDYEDRLDAEGKEALAFIRDNTRNMGRLIDDLLAFSRLGRQQMRIAEIDMTGLAQQVIDDLKQSATERSIELHVGALPVASVDPLLMRQVFFNLFDNAIKYTRPRDHAVIEVEGREDGNEHVYSVRDNGVGFEMQYVHKLFGVFQRLHSTEEFDGTGVGLAIVQRIVHRHGGRVWAEGEPGRGATFHFALPGGTDTAEEDGSRSSEDRDQEVNG